MPNNARQRRIDGHTPGARERGVALLAVLWATILLAVLATALIAMFRADARLMNTERARFEATEAARAAINLAIVALSNPAGGWPVDGTPQTIKFGDIAIDVAVSAESGKIDLNAGGLELIHGLLMVEGASPGAAGQITEEIGARRVNQGSDVANGIPAAATPHDPGMHQFQNMAELLQIPGITRPLFDRLIPNLTLYSGALTVDAKLAPIDVLLSIPGNTRADAEAALRARASGNTSTDAVTDLSRTIGRAFSVTALVQLPNGIAVHRSEIIRLTGDPSRPFWVLSVS
jgi:general secretion pathway protein K